MNPRTPVALLLLAALLGLACEQAYYSFWEKAGKEKRDLFRGHVEKVRDDQEEASEQFKDTLERIKVVYQVEDSELETSFRKLESSYEDAEARAAQVRERIDKLTNIAEDLFAEWEGEIASISSSELKSRSREKLVETRSRFKAMRAVMTAAEARMEPVLTRFRDQVLFMKHDLNARALADLQGEVVAIESEVDDLVADLQRSIAEADRFIGELNA
jgi:ElaB/YqjD/DUF883 family membrane-anchored ribosome-binding protein